MVCMWDKAKGVGRMSGDAGAFPDCEVIHGSHPITPPSRCTALGRIEPELVGLSMNVLALDVT